MAQCQRCGAPLPEGFSFGQTLEYCAQCQNAMSQVQPTTDRTSALFALSPVTIGLIAINALVFILMVARGVSPLEPGGQEIVRWGGQYGPFVLAGEWWR